MLKINKKVEYAIIGLLYMGDKPEGSLTTATELSENFKIPQEITRKVLQHLSKHKLIVSVQGVKGGYQLNERLENIKLTQVISAIEGPIQIVNCVEPDDICDCEQLDFCNIRNPMSILQQLVIQIFDSITLRDLKTHIPHVISNYPFLKAIIFFKDQESADKETAFRKIVFNRE